MTIVLNGLREPLVSRPESSPREEFFPTDVLSIVQKHLQDSPENLVKASHVCRQWRRDFDSAKPIIAAKERLWKWKQSALAEGIPIYLEGRFQLDNLSIAALPRVDLKGNTILKSLRTRFTQTNIYPSLLGAHTIESPIMLATDTKKKCALFFRLNTPEALEAYSTIRKMSYSEPLVVCVIFNGHGLNNNAQMYESGTTHPHRWTPCGSCWFQAPEGRAIVYGLLRAMKSTVQQTEGPLPNFPLLKKSNCLNAFFERIARCFSAFLQKIRG